MVMLYGPAVAAELRLLPAAVRNAARIDGGGHIPPLWRQILDALATANAAAMSECPSPDVRGGAASPQWLTPAEASDLLDLSERHVTRRGTEIGGRKVRGRWMFNRDDVEAEAERRKGK